MRVGIMRARARDACAHARERVRGESKEARQRDVERWAKNRESGMSEGNEFGGVRRVPEQHAARG